VGDVMKPLDVPAFNRLDVPGFTVTTARVEFEGICDECMTKN
jgi:Fur family ferric uptake transcriptional regulator